MASARTHTFYMPGEERIFFRHLHLIAIVLIAALTCLGILVSGKTASSSLLFALVVVLPFYLFCLAHRKRFAESIVLDFDARTARFSFSDQRGSFVRPFQDIKAIKFRFYLTFVLDDARIMIKRPPNKKEVFRLLQEVGSLESGMFDGI